MQELEKGIAQPAEQTSNSCQILVTPKLTKPE